MEELTQVFICPVKEELSQDEIQLLSTLLSPEEVFLTGKIADKNSRFSMLQSHAFKRKILAQALGTSEQSISFYTNTFGKPYLVRQAGQPVLYFNISHTQDMTAIIISNKESTGIDIENMVMPVKLPQPEFIFNCHELEKYEGITDNDLRRRFFLKTWVIKECFFKALGSGFTIDPSFLEIKKHDANFFYARQNGLENVENNYIQFCESDRFALAFTNNTGHIINVIKHKPG